MKKFFILSAYLFIISRLWVIIWGLCCCGNNLKSASNSFILVPDRNTLANHHFCSVRLRDIIINTGQPIDISVVSWNRIWILQLFHQMTCWKFNSAITLSGNNKFLSVVLPTRKLLSGPDCSFCPSSVIRSPLQHRQLHLMSTHSEWVCLLPETYDTVMYTYPHSW